MSYLFLISFPEKGNALKKEKRKEEDLLEVHCYGPGWIWKSLGPGLLSRDSESDGLEI